MPVSFLYPYVIDKSAKQKYHMSLVISVQVKCGSNFKRFNFRVDENNQMDLSMVVLRAKIRSVFNFTADTNFSLKYVDEEDDTVYLVDDDDLHDVVRQKLEMLRIEVYGNGFLPLEFSLWKSKISKSVWEFILKEEVLAFGCAFAGGLCSALIAIMLTKPKVESILPTQPVEPVEPAQPIQPVESFIKPAVRTGLFRYGQK
ncbi:PB1 domain protein [Medicago truncatula]|uniref:PB1 domain protein n=2 Tax=Medicago truncatula TaxID=3880 RepID=A0A072UPZ4_MEDTR|nr:PB1 domain protein [Medicago truncatula]